MKKGGGKHKGSAFERKICKQLSLWVSNDENEDLFWRSAMSGGRATVAKRKGKKLSRQAGDITATAPEGHALTDRYFIECKHIGNLALEGFFLSGVGALSSFWKTALSEASSYHRLPLLIAKQSHKPTLMITHISDTCLVPYFSDLPQVRITLRDIQCNVFLFDDVMNIHSGIELFKSKPVRIKLEK